MKDKQTNAASEAHQYHITFKNNEIDANKRMTSVSIFMAFVLFIIFLLYVTRVFPLNDYTLVYIFTPINICILLSPIFFKKTKYVEKPWYKYFMMGQVIFVVSTLNIIVPKHAMLGWALCMLLANHYYSPKFCLNVFVVCLIMMFCCIYLGMFFGEYDPNLLSSGIIRIDETGKPYLWKPDDFNGRVEMLDELRASGTNRYLKVFLYYYLSRAAFLTIIFFASMGLNYRTRKLLTDEASFSLRQKKMQAELSIASDIQLSSLPKQFIANDKYEIFGDMHAAKDVGGDFFDYALIDDEHIGFIIGDVSGKGVPAAMFMMQAITYFKTYVLLEKSPAKILSNINRELFKNNDKLMFITAFAGIMNIKTGKIVFANAGHNPPIIRTEGKENYHYLQCNHGFLLATLEECMLVDEEIELDYGGRLILYTDGVTEAKNKENKLYGEDRLLKLISERKFPKNIDIHQTILDDVKDFSSGVEQSDDITILSITYLCNNHHRDEIELDASIDNVKLGLDFIKKLMSEDSINNEIINKFNVSFDELFSNICQHGYKNRKGNVVIKYHYNKVEEYIELCIIDKSEKFNPLEVEEPDISLPAEERQIGGLGIFMTLNLMDETKYEYKQLKNIVTIRKYI